MQEGEEIEGNVSLWVGDAQSPDALDVYTDADYSNAGRHLSQFANDFGTGWYDHDFMDAYVHANSTRSLVELLKGCSYDNVITPRFVELCGEWLPEAANAAVVLYNFRHGGGLGPSTGNTVRLRFMGSISVPMPWPE